MNVQVKKQEIKQNKGSFHGSIRAWYDINLQEHKRHNDKPASQSQPAQGENRKFNRGDSRTAS